MIDKSGRREKEITIESLFVNTSKSNRVFALSSD
jgi:hypothetical protein